MKLFFIITSILILLFILFQLYTNMAIAKTETQAYSVMKVNREYEVRFYPSATMATITSTARTYRELGSTGFSKLAGYIFGGNQEKKQIAMTSPVHMDIGDSVSSMSFMMPSTFTKENLPIPNNLDVTIQSSKDEYVAVLAFDGFATNEKIKSHMKLLENSLKEHRQSYYGNFRYLGYNPPYQLFGRRNEIIVSIDWDSN